MRWIKAAFVTLYTPRPNSVRMPPTEAMLMTTPGWDLNDFSHACWVQNTGPRRLTSNVLSYLASSTSIVAP